eukprot:365123-Chlamydomonas_euryale.AAC.29
MPRPWCKHLADAYLSDRNKTIKRWERPNRLQNDAKGCRPRSKQQQGPAFEPNGFQRVPKGGVWGCLNPRAKLSLLRGSSRGSP